jgi:hypothetical protein
MIFYCAIFFSITAAIKPVRLSYLWLIISPFSSVLLVINLILRLIALLCAIELAKYGDVKVGDVILPCIHS